MRKRTLFSKLLTAMLLISLVPLLVFTLILFANLTATRESLVSGVSSSADRAASQNLEMRAKQIADTVAVFLRDCEADALLLAALPPTKDIATLFYDKHHLETWTRTGAPESAREIRQQVPRYRDIQIIDASGREIAAVLRGKSVSRERLRNLSRPDGYEYPGEDYFQQAARLSAGSVHVTHVTGFHVSKHEQLGGAADVESAATDTLYDGVVRFATPVYEKGRLARVVVLSLDHRHLMEFTQHVQPGTEAPTAVPSYKSGNYAFMFDDEGWIITHPKLWDIRGIDRATGRLVPPYSARSSREDIETGRIPYNLDHAGFIHGNYPVVARQVRERRSGYVDITNVGGAKKIMAYAPILYDSGPYSRYGIFGGITIGFQVDQFHEQARTGARIISGRLQEHLGESFIIMSLTALLVVAAAWFVSRGITKPLAQLTEGAHRLAEGATDHQVDISSTDELGELAETFNRMAVQLEQQKKNLLQTLEELRSSRREIIDERNFKQSILESISSAILTLSPAGCLTSLNGTGRRFFGDVQAGTHFTEIFGTAWADMPSRIAAALEKRKAYGREPLVVSKRSDRRHYEIGFFPISGEPVQGLTVTLRDETEKERLREEMMRMDRLASLGKLSAGIAHEVRNPLTGLTLLLDDLHDHANLDRSDQQMLTRALEEIERVEKLISSLLSYAAPPQAEFRLNDLTAVVQDTLLLFRRECEKKGTAISASLAEIPPFLFDGNKLRQALLNVLKNALDAVAGGGSIAVTTKATEDAAIIVVTDSGPGISPADLPLLFEPFFTRKGAGTGLGLSITQRIIEQEHHGSIEVSSIQGEGTTFVLSIPLQPPVLPSVSA